MAGHKIRPAGVLTDTDAWLSKTERSSQGPINGEKLGKIIRYYGFVHGLSHLHDIK